MSVTSANQSQRSLRHAFAGFADGFPPLDLSAGGRHGTGGDGAKQNIQPFSHGGVSEDRIAKRGIRLLRQYGHLDHRQISRLASPRTSRKSTLRFSARVSAITPSATQRFFPFTPSIAAAVETMSTFQHADASFASGSSLLPFLEPAFLLLTLEVRRFWWSNWERKHA